MARDTPKKSTATIVYKCQTLNWEFFLGDLPASIGKLYQIERIKQIEKVKNFSFTCEYSFTWLAVACHAPHATHGGDARGRPGVQETPTLKIYKRIRFEI